jgi:hypothetical protein
VVGAALDAYHYSYPPVLLLLTTPLALMTRVPALLACWRRVGTLSIAHCVWRCRAKARRGIALSGFNAAPLSIIRLGRAPTVCRNRQTVHSFVIASYQSRAS